MGSPGPERPKDSEAAQGPSRCQASQSQPEEKPSVTDPDPIVEWRWRPEWYRCIRSDTKDQALCGRSIAFEWAFVDRSHAENEVKREGRLVPCPKCLKEKLDNSPERE